MNADANARETLESGDDWLESVLRNDAAEHAHAYLDDAGFTARVVDSLPAAERAVPAWRKPAVLGLWTLAAAGSAVALPGVAIDVGREAFKLLVAHPVSLPQIAAVVAMIALGTWSAAAYALRHD
jgi:hypothetical protein